jgi:elongation factor Ts
MTIQITAELVKELRDRTGVSVMQCKNALEEAEGDMDKALIILKNKSSSIALKKEERNAKDGLVLVKEGQGKALLFTLRTETDFVAKNEDFINLANKLADMAMSEGVENMKTKSPEMISEIVQKVGEKIELGKIEEIKGDVIGIYSHNIKNAVVVSLSGGSKELAKDIAMHIAAMKPVYTKKEDITEEDKQRVIEVYEKEVASLDKPEEIKKKMLDGKINSYFSEITLMNQAYIKNPDITIEKLLENNGAKITSYVAEAII